MHRTYPSAGSVALGVIAAAVAASLPTLLLGPLAIIALPIALGIAIGHAVLIGLPAYLLLRRWLHLTYGSAAIAGFLVGAVPVALYNALSTVLFSAGTLSLLDRLWQAVPMSLVFGAFGTIGGLAFRRVVGESPIYEGIDPAIFE